MAKIFIPRGQDNIELCHPVDERDFERIIKIIDGSSTGKGWIPIAVYLVREDEGKRLSYASSPWLGEHALVFRPECFHVVGEYLKSGELLAASCIDAELYFFNPKCLDVVNLGASRVKRFKSGGIMMFESYSFLEEGVWGIDLFKIPNLRASPTFVSERFVDSWIGSKLTGLDFELVWNSSGPPIVKTLFERFNK